MDMDTQMYTQPKSNEQFSYSVRTRVKYDPEPNSLFPLAQPFFAKKLKQKPFNSFLSLYRVIYPNLTPPTLSFSLISMFLIDNAIWFIRYLSLCLSSLFELNFINLRVGLKYEIGYMNSSYDAFLLNVRVMFFC